VALCARGKAESTHSTKGIESHSESMPCLNQSAITAMEWDGHHFGGLAWPPSFAMALWLVVLLEVDAICSLALLSTKERREKERWRKNQN
jgi:hypothetical protein